MRSVSLIMLITSIFLSACSNKCIEDIGIQTNKELSLKAFDAIDAQSGIKLVLIQDSTYKVNIQTDSALISYVDADVSGSKLKLKLKREYCGSDSVVVRIGIGELKKLTTSGKVEVLSEQKLILNDVTLSLNDNTKLGLDLNAGKVTTNVDGIAEINLRGQAGSHILTSKGNVKIDAFDFVSGIYNLDLEGVCKANINVLNDLKVKTSGSSEIYYKGNPKKVEEKKSGAAKLEKVN